jgi:ABC-type multidrug transport system permease subunit
MKNILTIGHHEVKTLLRDPASWIWLLLMPLAFVYFMSFSSRPPGEPWDERPPVWVEDEDRGFMASILLYELEQQGLNVLTQERKEEAIRTLVIPEFFTRDILAKTQTKVRVLPVEGKQGEELRTRLIEAQLLRALLRLNSLMVEHATLKPASVPVEAELRELLQKPDPLRLDSRFAGRNPIPVGFNMSLPGILVQYLLMNLLIFGGSGVAQDRRSGVLRRMSIHPLSPGELLFGKLYGLMLLGIFQIVFFLVVGQFFMGVNIGNQLPGITLTLLLFSWVSASCGLLIGFLVRSEDRVIGVSLMIALPLTALGGCWWPMELVSESIRTWTLATPTAWAMQALHQLITYGSGIEAVVTHLFVLAGFGLVANLFAVRFFRT